MTNEQTRIAVDIRLGAIISLPQTCVCGTYSNHALVCKMVSGRQLRQRLYNEIIKRSLVSCGVATRLEPPGLSVEDGSRPDRITQITWVRERPAVCDFTCSHELATSWIRFATLEGSAIARQREIVDRAKYEALVKKSLKS